MILLCGIPSERPLAMVRDELLELGEPTVELNQRRFMETTVSFEITGTQVSGILDVDGHRHRLEDVCGVYTRLMDDQLLPELENEAPNSPKRLRAFAMTDALTQWCEIAQARVINRNAPMTSNFSKPYQSQLIRAHGFSIPETLITNDPELVMQFVERHRRVVYKSTSGVRSIVQMLEEADLPRLHHIRWCPTQFQAYVEGLDVRVHTVGSEVFATAVHSETPDYRYAHRAGHAPRLEPVSLSDDLAQQCVTLATDLGLVFAGIDLKITPEERVCCFEVNPSPAFSYYEAHTGQPIARAVAQYLVAGPVPWLQHKGVPSGQQSVNRDC